MSGDKMSDDHPSTNPASTPPSQQPSTARERFQQAAGDRIDAAPTAASERRLWEGGYCAKAMYGTWILSIFITIIVLVAIALFATEEMQNVWLIAGAALLIWWCLAIALFLYRRFSMHYELTTQRFVHQIGLLTRQTDRIEVIDIDDVSYRQGIVQRMLGVGTITITGSDRSHPELQLYGIDRVPEIASLIDDVRREERRRRALHIESI